jgi:hypothetical protein
LIQPELADVFVIDIYGDPVIVSWESTPDNQYLWGNTNDPKWQEFLLEQGKGLVDAGVDGIIIDEQLGTAMSLWNGGSFGEPDMTLFRAYLKSTYSDQELLNKFGIGVPDTFNYGDYIIGKNLANTWVSTPWTVPLYKEYLEFQYVEILKFMKQLTNQTRNYSKTTYGKQISFSANLYGLQAANLIFADLLDYYTVEFPYMGDGYPPESQAIPFYKLARALGNKPAITIMDTHTVADLMSRSTSTSNLMTIYIAEAYASRGALFVPEGVYGWSDAGGPTWYKGDMSVLGSRREVSMVEETSKAR